RVGSRRSRDPWRRGRPGSRDWFVPEEASSTPRRLTPAALGVVRRHTPGGLLPAYGRACTVRPSPTHAIALLAALDLVFLTRSFRRHLMRRNKQTNPTAAGCAGPGTARRVPNIVTAVTTR